MPPSNTSTCPPYFSSTHDFFNNVDNSPCNTCLPYLYVIWSINILCILRTVMKAYPVFKLRITTALEQNQPLWKISGFRATFFFFGLCTPGHFIYAVMKLANPYSSLGFDLATNIMFVVTRIGTYGTTYIHQASLLDKTINSNNPAFRIVIARSKAAYLITCLFSAFSGFVVFVTYANRDTADYSFQLAVAQTMWITSALQRILQAMGATYVRNAVFKILDEAITLQTDVEIRQRLQHTKHVVGDLQRMAMTYGMLNSTLQLVLAIVAPDQFAQFLPLVWVQLPFMGEKLINQMDLDNKLSRASRSASKARSKLPDGEDPRTAAPMSVYIGNLGGDDVETILTVREMNVGHETLFWALFGKQTALNAARTFQQAQWTIILFVYGTGVSILCILVLLGILPKWISFVILFLALIAFARVFCTVVSLPVLKCLLTTSSAYVMRVLVLVVWCCCVSDVLAWDERIIIPVVLAFGIASVFTVDAWVREAKNQLQPVALLVLGSVSFWMFGLLVWDVLDDRRNTHINIPFGSYVFSYSTYQASRDVNLVIAILSFKDMVAIVTERRRNTNFFLHLTAHVNVHVIALETILQEQASKKNSRVDLPVLEFHDTGAWGGHGTTQPKVFDVLPTSNGAEPEPLVLNAGPQFSGWDAIVAPKLRIANGRLAFGRDEVNSSPSKGEEEEEAGSSSGVGGNAGEATTKARMAWVNTIVMRESETIAVMMLGQVRGAKFIYWAGHPLLRAAFKIIESVCLGIWICGVLPGLLPEEFSLMVIFSLLVLVRNFSVKSVPLMKLLARSVEFCVEVVSAMFTLSLLAVTIGPNLRVLGVPVLLLFWLDIRMNDARAVFWHSSTRGSHYRNGRILTGMNYGATAALDVTMLALPVILSIGALSHPAPVASFYLRPGNYTGISQYGMPPSGTFSLIQLDQFVGDFLFTFAFKYILDGAVDLLRSSKSRVKLEYLVAPVTAKFVDFVMDVNKEGRVLNDLEARFETEPVSVMVLGEPDRLRPGGGGRVESFRSFDQGTSFAKRRLVSGAYQQQTPVLSSASSSIAHMHTTTTSRVGTSGGGGIMEVVAPGDG